MIDHVIANEGHVTDVVAVAGVFSPFWLPWLHTVSAEFAILVPILAGTWLFVQIVRALIQGFFSWQAWRNPPK